MTPSAMEAMRPATPDGAAPPDAFALLGSLVAAESPFEPLAHPARSATPVATMAKLAPERARRWTEDEEVTMVLL
jgi:hypothetical protein